MVTSIILVTKNVIKNWNQLICSAIHIPNSAHILHLLDTED